MGSVGALGVSSSASYQDDPRSNRMWVKLLHIEIQSMLSPDVKKKNFSDVPYIEIAS